MIRIALADVNFSRKSTNSGISFAGKFTTQRTVSRIRRRSFNHYTVSRLYARIPCNLSRPPPFEKLQREESSDSLRPRRNALECLSSGRPSVPATPLRSPNPSPPAVSFQPSKANQRIPEFFLTVEDPWYRFYTPRRAIV